MSQREDIPIRLYRPSNGTEGHCFIEQWCFNCVRDREHRETGWEGCQIVADALAYQITDPKYPRQWIEVGDVPGVPECTAFVKDEGQKWPALATPIELEAAGQQRLLP